MDIKRYETPSGPRIIIRVRGRTLAEVVTHCLLERGALFTVGPDNTHGFTIISYRADHGFTGHVVRALEAATADALDDLALDKIRQDIDAAPDQKPAGYGAVPTSIPPEAKPRRRRRTRPDADGESEASAS